jgi:hypothetical protein
MTALSGITHPPIYQLAVNKLPRSGAAVELMDFEEINAKAIIEWCRKNK